MVATASDDALARQLRELEVLYDGLRALTSTLDLSALVQTVLARIKHVTSAEALSLLLHDSGRGELVFAASETLCADTIVGPPALAPRAVGLSDQALSVALRRDGRLLGFLDVRDRYDDQPFDDADRSALETCAAALSATLEVPTLAHDHAALQRVFARVAATVPSHSTVLTLIDADGHELVFTSARTLRAGVVDGVRLRLDQGIAGWVARFREPVVLADASRDPRHDPEVARRTGLTPHSMICVPLVYRDTLLGVLQVINKLDGAEFTAEEVRLTQALAGHAALAIANAQLYRRAEVASLTDDLTGLANTRHFNAVLPALLARGGTTSLLMLDLDALKAVVDRDGHQVGSRTIATVGRLIAERLRPGDLAARFGGDEFVVLLPGASTDDAVAIAERIRAAVADCATPDDGAADIRAVTASIGVATYPTHALDAPALVRAADTAMYAVKGARKNGVAIASA